MCPSSSHLHPNPTGDIPCVLPHPTFTPTHLGTSHVSPTHPTHTPTHLPSSSHASQLISPTAPPIHPIPGPPANSFEVSVEGTASEVGYGGTVLLNCSSSCPEAGAPGGLETSLSKEWVGRGPGWLTIRLHNITEPFSDVFCYFSCFGERKVVTFRVLAYGKRRLGSFPWGFPRWMGDVADLGSPHPWWGSGMGQSGGGAGAVTGPEWVGECWDEPGARSGNGCHWDEPVAGSGSWCHWLG